MSIAKNLKWALSKITMKALFAFIFLFCLNILSYSQTKIQVTGKVVDNTGKPISGASVRVQGTTTGVACNESGVFNLSVTVDKNLLISAMGFASREFTVHADSKNITIILTQATTELEQVVVVGYGTQKKKDVTGSVVSISEQALRDVPVANIQGALQGKAAGLDIQTVGTTPGSGAQIRIRGTKSIFGSNDPLIVLDGIPFDGSLNDINPDEIASVDVLKDASATAIYGSRGANGVILITSKKGKAGETRVSYNGYDGISKVANKYPVFNATEYQAMRNISTWNQGYEPDELASIAAGKSTDWQDLMYQNAYKSDKNISVSGGSANGSTFALGAGYYKETSVLPGQDFTRFTLRSAVDGKIGNKIKVGLNTLNNVSTTKGNQFVSPMYPILSLSPLMPAYDANGNILRSPTGDNDDRLTQYSPLYLKNNRNNWVDQSRRLATYNSLYGELEIVKGLKYRVNLGLNFIQTESDQFRSADDTVNNPSYFRPLQGNTATVNNSSQWSYTVENIITYDKTIKKHRFGFTGLYSVQEGQFHNTSVQKDSITGDFSQFYALNLSNPTPAAVVSGGESKSALISYMGRLNYAFDNRYLLTVTFRADGSSRLAEGNKWHQYPAVSAGWIVSNEKFMQDFSWLSNLKLRAGFGQTSNQSISPYQSLGLVNNSNGLSSPGNVIRYNFGPSIVTGYNVINLPNANLDWEYTKTTNIGLDFGFLRNRITGSIEYYNSQTNKILSNITLPPTSGVAGSYQTNVGKMENKGIELSISSLNIDKKGFTWTTDFNLFFNKNKLLSLYNGFDKDISNQLFSGYSMNSIFDYNKLGIWQKSEAALAATFGATPGQIKIEDHNGDGKITTDDRYVIGNGDPKLQGGMTNRFAYKGFDFSFVLYGRFGGLLVSQIHQSASSYLVNMDGKRNGIKVDYWTPTNSTDWFPNPSAQSLNGTTTWSPISTAWTTLGYYNASFLKVRSINFGYTFNSVILKKLNAQRIRLYLTVDNVATLFSPYMNQTGISPDGTNLGSSGVSNPGNLRSNTYGNGMVTISSSTPLARSFSIGANITF